MDAKTGSRGNAAWRFCRAQAGQSDCQGTGLASVLRLASLRLSFCLGAPMLLILARRLLRKSLRSLAEANEAHRALGTVRLRSPELAGGFVTSRAVACKLEKARTSQWPRPINRPHRHVLGPGVLERYGMRRPSAREERRLRVAYRRQHAGRIQRCAVEFHRQYPFCSELPMSALGPACSCSVSHGTTGQTKPPAGLLLMCQLSIPAADHWQKIICPQMRMDG